MHVKYYVYFFRFKENIIRQTCETAILGCLYPRTGISLTIQELEDYGGVKIFIICVKYLFKSDYTEILL